MANEPRQPNLQDAFLNRLRKEKTPVTVIVINGYQLNHMAITGYDNFVIIAEQGGKPVMLYKHAISTIIPEGKPKAGEEKPYECE